MNDDRPDTEELRRIGRDLSAFYEGPVAIAAADLIDAMWAEVELLRSRLATARTDALNEAATAYLAERGARYMPLQVASWLRGRAVGQTK